MKNNSVSIERIADRLVEVLTNEQLTAEYKKAGHVSECYGWDGRAMSPLSREAFVDAFGLESVETAEAMAARVVEIRRNAFAATAYAAHAAEADEQLSQYPATTPAAGSFVWGFSSDYKCCNGLADELANRAGCERSGCTIAPTLCKVCEVYEMTSEEVAAAGGFEELISRHEGGAAGFPGGSRSEDEGVTGVDGDEFATYYTLTAAVVMPGGRWFLIDSEGYNYGRYIYLPATASDMFADEFAAIRAAEEAREAEEHRKAEEEAAARLADYRARCAKWSPLMTSTKPAAEAVAAAHAAYENRQKLSGYSFARKSAEKKALDAAERKLHNTARANILAMVRAAFPGVSFSVKNNSARGYGFGEDWLLSWTDGPTVVELTAAVDLDLFTRTSYEPDQCDGFDPIRAEFTEFVDEFGEGPHHAGGVEVSREKGDEFDALKATAEAVEVSNAQDMTADDAAAVADALGCSRSFLMVKAGRRYWLTAYECALYVWNDRNFYHREEPTTPTEPEGTSGAAYGDGQESQPATAPAEDAAPAAAAAAYGDGQKLGTATDAESYTIEKTDDGAAIIIDGEKIERGSVLTIAGTGGKARDRYHVESVSSERVTACRIKDGHPSPYSGAWSSSCADFVQQYRARRLAPAEKYNAAAELRRCAAELIREAEELEAAAARAAVAAAYGDGQKLETTDGQCRARGGRWPYPPMKEGEKPFPVFDPDDLIPATAAEARAAGKYIVGLMVKAGSDAQVEPTFTPMCDEYQTHPANLLAYLWKLRDSGEITHMETYSDFYGIAVQYCAGNGWYRKIFVDTIPQGTQRAYPVDMLQLTAWANTVEAADPSTNEAKATA